MAATNLYGRELLIEAIERRARRDHDLRSWLDQCLANFELMPKRLARRRQDMRERQRALLDSAREHLRVDAIGLAAVIADAQSFHSRRIDQQRPVPPTFEYGERGPRLATCFDRDLRRVGVGPENIFELFERAHGSSSDHLAVMDLAEADLPQTQIQR